VDLLARDRLGAESPMLRFEHALVPWNKHFIMPVFALANAGVVLGAGAAHSLTDPISMGVIFGLVLGKPIGIVLFSGLAVRSRVAAMLDGISWRQILGIGMLGGIGFTMSLFIANLAFGETPALETAKVGILAASIVSGIAGAVVLLRRRPIPL
jgi:Na+:H+ antiporter, NhaA family